MILWVLIPPESWKFFEKSTRNGSKIAQKWLPKFSEIAKNQPRISCFFFCTSTKTHQTTSNDLPTCCMIGYCWFWWFFKNFDFFEMFVSFFVPREVGTFPKKTLIFVRAKYAVFDILWGKVPTLWWFEKWKKITPHSNLRSLPTLTRCIHTPSGTNNFS